MPDPTEHDDALRVDDLRALADLGLAPDAQQPMTERVIARVTAPRPHRARRRLAVTPRRLNLSALAATMGVLAVGATATAAVGLWDPPLGENQPTQATAGSSEVPAEQLDRFGVLRRDATAEDRDAATRNALRYLSDKYQGVRTDRIRAPAAGLVLVPVEEAVATGDRDALCLFATDNAGGGVGCWSTQDVLAGRAVLIALPEQTAAPTSTTAASLRPTAEGGTVTGLVPDGVTTVELNGRRAAVTDNAFTLPLTNAPTSAIIWRDQTGSEVHKG